MRGVIIITQTASKGAKCVRLPDGESLDLVGAGDDAADVREDDVVVRQLVDGVVHLTKWPTIHLKLNLNRQRVARLDVQAVHAPVNQSQRVSKLQLHSSINHSK